MRGRETREGFFYQKFAHYSVNRPIIPPEEVNSLHFHLKSILHDSELTDRQSYYALQMLLRSIILLLVKSERQFFANDFARLLFLADKYSFPTHIVESLHKNRVLATRIRQGKSEIGKGAIRVIRRAIVLLLGYSSDIPLPKEFESFITKINSDYVPATLFEQAAEIIPFVRLEIIDTSLIKEKEQFPVQCTMLDEDGMEWKVLLSRDFMRQTVFFRIGTTVHCTSMTRAKTSEQILLSTPETLLVIEPDIVLDVTEIAECFSGRNPSIYLYFIKKVQKINPSSREMVIGTVINSCLDELLTNPDADIYTIVRKALFYKPITAIAALGEADETSIVEEITPHFNNLRSIIPALRYDTFTVEASFISPLYGLQGRLDVLLEYADEPERKTIIELKSGKPPSAYNQRGNAAYGMWKNHEAQILCYNLLLDSAYPNRKGDSSVLYSRETVTPLRNMPNETNAKRGVLELRNAIITAEKDLLNRKFGLYAGLNDDEFNDAPSFIRDKFIAAKEFLHNLSELETVYFRATYSFLLREQYAGRSGTQHDDNDYGFAGLWRTSLEEKKNSFSIITDLILDEEQCDFEKMHLCFLRAEQSLPTSLREGDIILLYAFSEEKTPVQGQMIKGSIRRMTDRNIIISLRNKLIHPSFFLAESDKTWIVEPDYMDSSYSVLYNVTAQFLQSPQPIRNVLLGVQSPQKHKPKEYDIEAYCAECESLPSLSEEQRNILQLMMSGQEYFLLQGPPGTGKTSVMLKWCARTFFVSETGTVLIAAYTNRAVDEILRSVQSVVLNEYIIRLGSKDSTEYPEYTLDTFSEGKKLKDISNHIKNARFIIGTISSVLANTDLFSIKQFSLFVVDEAAQIIEPNIIGLSAIIGRTILIGDEKQLPAIIVQNETQTTIQHPLTDVIHFRDFRMSLFERLLRCCHAHSWNHAFAMLSKQGRMHKDIATFVNGKFYNNELMPALSWQSEQTISLYSDTQFLPDFLREHSGVFIPIYTTDKGKIHRTEAKIAANIAALCAAALGDNFGDQSIGIITPFRAQITEIKQCLPSLLRARITVDTVERFQGSEREIIIISFAINHNSMLASVSAPVEINGIIVDRKLNVAITRARRQLIVIGNPEILSQQPLLKDFIDSLKKTDSEQVI